MNHVDYLLSISHHTLSKADKLAIKKLGPYQPSDYSYSVQDGKQTRHFNNEWFKQFPWLTVDTNTNKLFCFNCLLFANRGTTKNQTWFKQGYTSIKNFVERATLHRKSADHLLSSSRIKTFGTAPSIAAILNKGISLANQKHNNKVKENRYILNSIIESIKFCGTHELGLRGHVEHGDATNKGVFQGLLSLIGNYDSKIKHHLETATVAKYTSPDIQNEILDIIYDVYIDDLKNNINKTNFVAVEADEATDICCKSQFAIILRFIKDNIPVERFLKFVEVHDRTGEGLASVIIDELRPYGVRNKLIAQAYDGATVMSGEHRGVQSFVKDVYTEAHYIHCYAHQTNLVIQKLSSSIPQVNLFFTGLSSFSTFFSSSPKRADALRETANNKRLSKTCETRWNYRSRMIKDIKTFRKEILECLDNIQLSASWDSKTQQEAVGLSRTIEDPVFTFLLSFFDEVFQHVDVLFKQFQTRATTGGDLCKNIEYFCNVIQQIRKDLPEFVESEGRRRVRNPRADALEVCDILTNQLTDRLDKSDFLKAYAIVDPQNFSKYHLHFPNSHLKTIIEHYSFLEQESLQTELEVIYSNESFYAESVSDTTIKLYEYMRSLELQEEFPEVIKLLQIVLTTPVHTAEPERTFSTLSRVKCSTRNAMSQDRLNALTALSVHKEDIAKDTQFNERVMDIFATKKDRRADFIFKQV